jgi:hypothetical protein
MSKLLHFVNICLDFQYKLTYFTPSFFKCNALKLKYK